LDRLTSIARELFGARYALISLVDSERQWFLANIGGIAATETPRDVSFCGHAILSSETLVVPDARLDPRFADNPLVVGYPSIRFYAGAPLKTDDGFAIGTLCVIDDEPHEFGQEKFALLAHLARAVEDEVARIRTARNRQALEDAQNSLEKKPEAPPYHHEVPSRLH
jgi:GAF domain-containing protein